MKELEKRLNHKFKDFSLLEKALTHKSYAHELKAASSGTKETAKETALLKDDNERLEFLGDAVLDLVIGEFLMELFPKDREGSLSKKRAAVVNEETLATLASDIHLSQFLFLGKGEALTGGAGKPRLLSGCFEAIIGAIFLDAGFEKARSFVRERFSVYIQNMDPELEYERDYKTRLQEVIQKELKLTPTYQLLKEEGPAHERLFTSQVNAADTVLAIGSGKTKKTAEQEAARLALESKGLK